MLNYFNNIYGVELVDTNSYKLININNQAFYLNINSINTKLNLWDKIYIEGNTKGNYFENIQNVKFLKSYDFRIHIFKFFNSHNSVYSEFVIPLLFGHSVNYKNSPFSYASELGLVHILIISGMHFQLHAMFLNKVFKRKAKNITYIICFVYGIICFKSISVNRAFFSILLNSALNKKTYKESKFSLIVVLTIFFTSNLRVNSQGYGLSFILSIFISNMQKHNKNKSLLSYVANYFQIWIISASLIVVGKQDINITSGFLSLVISPIFEILYICLILLIGLPPALVFIRFILDNSLSLLLFGKISLNVNGIIMSILFTGCFISFSTVFINKKENKI